MSPSPTPLDPAVLAALMKDNRGSQLAGVMITSLVISLVVVSLRFYTRLVIVRKTGADDWSALVSFICLVVAFGLLGTAIIYGLGKHAATLKMERVIFAMKLVWIAFQFTPTAEATGKISVALLLMRVTTNKIWKRFFVVLIILNIGINIGMMFSILMSCWPVQMLWDPRVPGHCNILQRNVMSYIQGGSAAISDMVLAIAPIILLWNVQTSKGTKWLLCGLLSIGFFTAGAGFVRVGFTYETYSETTKTDPTWGLMDFIIWKCVELGLSVIVGCLPTLRPLFAGRSWTRVGYSGNSGGKRSGGSGVSGGHEDGMKIHKSNEIKLQWSARTMNNSSDGVPLTTTINSGRELV